jgi:hypothetical protein
MEGAPYNFTHADLQTKTVMLSRTGLTQNLTSYDPALVIYLTHLTLE